MEMLDVIGFTGLVLLLGAFIMNQVKVLESEGVIYQLMNLLGGYILTYYAFRLDNTPFLILEFVWGSFSLYKLLTLRRSAAVSDH